MSRNVVVCVGLAVSAVFFPSVVAAEPQPPASQWIPAEAIIALELSPPDLMDLVLDPEVAKKVTSFPAYQQLASQPAFKQFLGIVSYLEYRLDTDWRAGVRKLLGGGVTFAAGPGEGVLLIVDAEDGQLLKRLHEVLREEAEKHGQPASAPYRGVTGWTFGPNLTHAIIGNRLLVSNKPEVLKAVLDLRADPDGRSLASLPAYQAAKRAVGPDACGSVFINMGVLNQLPGVQQALEQGRNPTGSLLFAGATEALRASKWLALGLQIDQQTLTLQVAVDAKATGASGLATFAQPAGPGAGAMPNLAVPRRIAGLSFYRDMHQFYAAKDELFPERTSGLIFFENMMGIFFSGRDLTEEVLAETKPEVRFVVAEQAYDPAIGTPQVQFPAFAAIVGLRNAEEFAEVAEEAWQAAVGLTSFTSGQQGLPKLTIDRVLQGDVKFTIAYYSSKGLKERTNIDTRFNFRPALAVAEEYLILSSTEGLARDLIDAVKEETADAVKPLAGVHTLMELDVVQLASILGANREQLVRQNMLNEGNKPEEAEAATDALLTILKHLGQAKLTMGTRDGQHHASLELKLNLR